MFKSCNEKTTITIFRASIILILIGAWFNIPPHQVAAQNSGQITIPYSPIVDQFPNIQFFLDAYNENGLFITDLIPEQIMIIENGNNREVTTLERLDPGVQLSVALNTGPLMQNHYNGVSNYKRIQETIKEWSLAQPFETPHDFSMTTSTGLQATHLTIPADWARTIESYQPDLVNLQPSLTSITQALEIAATPLSNPLMKRSILFITPSMNNDLLASFNSIIENAVEQKVIVHIWLVGTSQAENSSTAEVLQRFAARTGGSFFLFTGAEDLPDIEYYMQSMRYIYRVTYQSGIQESGKYDFSLNIEREGLSINSESISFDITVLPPNPIFLSPPTQIVRAWSNTDGKAQSLRPSSILINTIIEFPDDHQRTIQYSALYVDGEIVTENHEAPFEHFKWNLEPYEISEMHTLQVKIIDALGLEGNSIETPVQLIVEQEAAGFFSVDNLIIASAVLAAAVVLGTVLTFTSKRFIPLQRRAHNSREFRDPVTQPVKVHWEKTNPRTSAESENPTISRRATVVSMAKLVRIASGGNTPSDEPIALDENELTLGSDPQQAIRLINSPSISSLHARIFRTQDGIFMVADAGSVAGTWLNYAPVSSQGARLEHGDLVHFGREAFRFELTTSPVLRQPKITPYEKEH